MQYLYHPEASVSQLYLSGESHRYLFKVRRHRTGERVYLRNLQDNTLYIYEITALDKKEATLLLQSQQELVVKTEKKLHIGWCMIDPKSIEKVLPSLNEMGVEKITFVYCARSQKQFSPDFDRLQKILLNSSQQCGRSRMMTLEIEESLSAFVVKYPDAFLLHFSEKRLSTMKQIDTVVVGCEGGLTDAECALFDTGRVVGLDTPLILRSESAATSVASMLLL